MTKQKNRKRLIALLLTLVMCVGMIPTAFAAQQNSYHDPAEHWLLSLIHILTDVRSSVVGAFKPFPRSGEDLSCGARDGSFFMPGPSLLFSGIGYPSS